MLGRWIFLILQRGLIIRGLVGLFLAFGSLVIGLACPVSAFAGSSVGAEVPLEILGTWKYTQFFYDGNYYNPPNPNLYLTFTFSDTGVQRLYWETKGESGFCERLAYYSLDGEMLTQKIFYVNPDNKPECSRDPDMQMDKETTTKIKIVGSQLQLFLELNQKDFIYILTKI